MSPSRNGDNKYEIHISLRDGRIVAAKILPTGMINPQFLAIGMPYEDVPTVLSNVFGVCAAAHRAAALGAIEQATKDKPDETAKRQRAHAVLSERLINGLWRLAIDWPHALGLVERPALIVALKHLLLPNIPRKAAQIGISEILAKTEKATLVQVMTEAVNQSDTGNGHFLSDLIGGATQEPENTLNSLLALMDGAPPKAEWWGENGIVQTSRGLLIHTASVSMDRIRDYAVITPTSRIMAAGGTLERILVGLDGSALLRTVNARIALLDPCAETDIRIVEASDA